MLGYSKKQSKKTILILILQIISYYRSKNKRCFSNLYLLASDLNSPNVLYIK
jgi:hypothetical protein